MVTPGVDMVTSYCPVCRALQTSDWGGRQSGDLDAGCQHGPTSEPQGGADSLLGVVIEGTTAPSRAVCSLIF